MPQSRPETRFIFITGGVVSALGKGIAAASLGRLLVARGLSVTIQKFDPYINVDPGTMSPFQHGEVFVTEDGAETDLDLGHYERFTDTNTSRASNATAGAIYNSVIRRERPCCVCSIKACWSLTSCSTCLIFSSRPWSASSLFAILFVSLVT